MRDPLGLSWNSYNSPKDSLRSMRRTGEERGKKSSKEPQPQIQPCSSPERGGIRLRLALPTAGGAKRLGGRSCRTGQEELRLSSEG